MTKAVLIILDGWGYRKNKKDNAIKQAKTPVMDRLWKSSPHAILNASSEAVGLPKNTIGNSEVGHLTLGAGRIIPQSLSRINQSIKDHSFYQNKAFLSAIKYCKRNQSTLHIMGLIQDQGVHAMSSHAIALLKLCQKQEFNNVAFHAFTDGRDTHPKSARRFVKEIEDALNSTRSGRMATISGRFYAMDRDKRWQRTRKAYEAVMNAKGRVAKSPKSALNIAYKKGEYDEFITPTVIDDYSGVKSNDAVIFFNFRYDRARQLTQAMTESKFTAFSRKHAPISHFVAMTPYYDGMNATVAFPETDLHNVLGEVLSKNKLKQLRVAETEKYAHVTYFLNGEKEQPFKREDRILIKSRRGVRTYDKAPAMRAKEIADVVIRAMKNSSHDVIIANFSNADMVGHTGNFKAAVKAIEILDICIGRILAASSKVSKSSKTFSKDTTSIPIIITADHGNAEQKGGNWQTAHTTNPVPIILVNKKAKLKNGGLAGVAPTLLKLLNIKQPKEMTGKSLF